MRMPQIANFQINIRDSQHSNEICRLALYMIEGVTIKILKVHQDIPDVKDSNVEPGFLMEVLRRDDEQFKKFGQTVFTVANQGTIKAFHWHKNQDDIWFVATGKAKIVLYDKRENSKTFGQTQVIEAGLDDYKTVLIPAGVVHGYKVVSKDPALLFYHVTEMYDANNPDEQRIPYDDKEIGFNWESV